MSQAKLHSHVPKFGDWDNDDLPYTAYFENARKERTGKRMNPNDPEENPEAFMGRGGLGSRCDCHPVQQVPLAADSNKSISADKHHTDGQSRQKFPNRNGFYDHQKSARSDRSMAAEYGSEKSNSDSALQSNYRRASSGQKKGWAGGSGSYQIDGNKQHHRTASIPKFGEWDETDPASGEGFTAIFNQVKEEKQAPYSNFPNVPPQPSNYSDYHKSKRRIPFFCSKICCCLFSRGSD